LATGGAANEPRPPPTITIAVMSPLLSPNERATVDITGTHMPLIPTPMHIP